MSTTETSALDEKLLSFFSEMASTKNENNFDKDKEAFLFHMTDWAADLQDLAELYAQPAGFDHQRARGILQGLFFHMLPHLNAAAEMYDDASHIYKMHNREKPPVNGSQSS